MAEKQVCTRCVLDTEFPHITFDDDGVCSYCHAWDKRWKDFDFEKSERQLVRLFERIKKMRRPYDCLVTYSGGRDSSYVLYLCKRKYGLNPLAVTFNTGFMSDYAVENILNTVRILGVDHVLHTYDWDRMQKMYGTMMKKAGEFCSICANGIFYVEKVYQEAIRLRNRSWRFFRRSAVLDSPVVS